MAITSQMLLQAGVLAIQNGRICVVTSRSGRRWVLPKGCMEPGKTAGEIALQEAWEEAGLVGALHPEPIGSYLYDKAGCTCHVTLFLLQVSEAADDWPEIDMRTREWLDFPQAISRLDEPGLRDVIRMIQARRLAK